MSEEIKKKFRRKTGQTQHQPKYDRTLYHIFRRVSRKSSRKTGPAASIQTLQTFSCIIVSLFLLMIYGVIANNTNRGRNGPAPGANNLFLVERYGSFLEPRFQLEKARVISTTSRARLDSLSQVEANNKHHHLTDYHWQAESLSVRLEIVRVPFVQVDELDKTSATRAITHSVE